MDSKAAVAIINGIIGALTIAPQLISQIKSLVRLLDRLESGGSVTEDEVQALFSDMGQRSRRIQDS